MWGRVDVRWVAGVAIGLILVPEGSFAQSGPPPGARPGFNRTPSVAVPTNRRPQTDLLDLRDRYDVLPVTPLAAVSNAIHCVAGCGDATAKAIATAPLRSGAILAVVGSVVARPIEDAKLIKAALVTPSAPPAPPTGDAGVITCLAGCDASDRRVLQATGGPMPVLPRHQPMVPQRLITAAAAPIVTAPVLKAPAKAATAVAPVKLKRTYAAHAKRVEKRSKVAARKPSGARIAQETKPSTAKAPRPHLAAVGMPTPIQPTQPGQKPQPAVSPKRPVSVNTSSDWFNKISREQATKKKDEAVQ